MSLAKFCSLLSREELFFSLVSNMNDEYEGFVYPPDPRGKEERLQQAERIAHEVISGIMKTAVVSCWTESEHESSLMWNAYASSEGVAVRTTFQKLKDSICSHDPPQAHFGRVEYVDYKSEVPRLDLAPLFHKRAEYREEGEVRIILPGPAYDLRIYEQHPHDTLEDRVPLAPEEVVLPRGRYVPVDLEILVKEVVLPPKAASWFAEVVESVIANSSVSPRVVRSSIDSPPHVSAQR